MIDWQVGEGIFPPHRYKGVGTKKVIGRGASSAPTYLETREREVFPTALRAAEAVPYKGKATLTESRLAH